MGFRIELLLLSVTGLENWTRPSIDEPPIFGFQGKFLEFLMLSVTGLENWTRPSIDEPPIFGFQGEFLMLSVTGLENCTRPSIDEPPIFGFQGEFLMLSVTGLENWTRPSIDELGVPREPWQWVHERNQKKFNLQVLQNTCVVILTSNSYSCFDEEPEPEFVNA